MIESIYYKSNEESVIGDKLKASIMESKKPLSATSTSNTRADRVHGMINFITSYAVFLKYISIYIFFFRFHQQQIHQKVFNYHIHF